MKNTITLSGPDIPPKGFVSSQDPSVLPPGVFTYLSGFRCRNGILEVRNPHVELSSSAAISGGTFKGAWSGILGTSAWAFAAWRVSGATRVYSLNTSTGAWTEFTDSTTRFASDGNVGFDAVPLIDWSSGSSYDGVIIGNGVDDCRVYTATVGNPVGIQSQLSAPAWAKQTATPNAWMFYTGGSTDYKYASTSSKLTASFSLTYGAQVTLTTTASSSETLALLWGAQRQLGSLGATDSLTTGFTLQNELGILCRTTSSTPTSLFGLTTDTQVINDLWEYVSTLALLSTSAAPVNIASSTNATPIAITTSSAHGLTTGDYVYVTGHTINTAANGVWPVTVSSSTVFSLDGSVGVGVGGATGTVRKLTVTGIYDASTGQQAPRKYKAPDTTGGADGQFVVFDTSDYAGLTGVLGLKITTTGTAPSANVVTQFLSVCTTGKAFGDSRYALAYYNAAGYSESVATACDVTVGTFPVHHITALSKNYRFDFGGNTYSAFRLTMPDNATSGVTGLVYRSDNEIQADGTYAYSPYYYLGSTYGPMALGSFGSSPAAKNTAVNDRDITKTARDVGVTVTPKGRILRYVNGRLYVSGLDASGAASQLWISKDLDPFYFRKVAEIDDSGNVLAASPIYRTFNGEQITAIERMTGDILGVDAVLLWTSARHYRVRGADARSLSQAAVIGTRGTRHPRSVSIFDNQAWYLDSEGQIAFSNGSSSQQISRNQVDATLAASSLTAPCGMANENQYALFYDGPSDSSLNKRAMIFDFLAGGFIEDTYSASNLEFACVLAIDESPRRKLIGITSTGRTWQLEKTPVPATPSTYLEGGSGIPVAAWPREVSSGLWSQINFGSIGVYMDAVYGSASTKVDTTLTTERLDPLTNVSNGGGNATRINLASGVTSTTDAARWDADSSGYPVGSQGLSTIIKLSGNLPAGIRIRKFVVEANPADGEKADVA